MNAVKFIEERNRMCKSFDGRCKECPGFDVFDVFEETPCVFDRESTLDATAQVAIVEKWSAAHSRKTRQDVFLEQYPETALDKHGIIQICPTTLFAAYKSSKLGCKNFNITCSDCRRGFWMQEVE